ncbi:MAG: phage holin family protein [Burkholderiaceae bacterium]
MHDDAPPPDEALSLPKAVGALLADLPGLLTDRVRLLALELRRASGALGQIVALGLLAAILLSTAWLTMWVGLAAALMAAGLEWPWVVLLMLAVNVTAAVWALMRVKALAPLLALPATLRRLTDSDHRERADERQREFEARQSDDPRP